MKIVRIITRLNIGGPSVHVGLLSTLLDRSRFDTCLVTGTVGEKEGDLGPRISARGARMIRLATLTRSPHPVRDLSTWFRLLSILRAERPRILHTHMAKAGTLGRLAGLFYNRLGPGRNPKNRMILIHTYHGHVLEGYFSAWVSNRFTAIERWLSRWTDCLIAVSPRIRDDLLGKGIGRKESWRVIPLGLDLSNLLDLSLPNGDLPLRCGMVGRLVPIKNPSLFLQALSRSARAGDSPAPRGIIVGEGPLRDSLEKEAQRIGLGDRVRFTGWQQDLRCCYQEMDIACVTSLNEGTPVSLIEAMAAGRAVIATDVGGVRDLLDTQAEGTPPIPAEGFRITPVGVLIRSQDAQGLAAALAHLAQNPSLRRSLGETARRHVRERYGHERLIGDLSRLYEQLTREGSPSPSV